MIKGLAVMMGFLVLTMIVQAQPAGVRGDSWEEVFKNKKGTVTAFWDDIEPLYM